MILDTNLKIGFWNAWIFMSVFIIQMIIILFANKAVRKRSHVPEEYRRTGLEKYIGIMANIIWFAALVYSVFLPLLHGTLWFYLGLVVFACGVMILTTATANFMTTPGDQLIQKGVYKFSRHPMYLSTFMICLGSGIATASWIFILLTFIMILCFHYEALLEEKYCLNKFPEQYKKYMLRVPRWFGFPRILLMSKNK